MKKCKICTFLLAMLMVLSSFAVTVSAAPAPFEVGDGYIKFDYSAIFSGLSSGKPDADIQKNVEFEGRNAVRLTPVGSSAQGGSFTLDSYSIHQYASKGAAITLPDYKFASVTYYYATDDPTYRNKPLSINILPGSTKVVTGYAGASSNNNIVTNQWATAYFNLSESITAKFNPDTDKPYVSQIHFMPFRSIKPQELLSTDVIYVSDMTFYKENPDKDAKFDVAFNKGNPEAKGDEPSYLYHYGEKFTLPENPFDFGESEFLGWIYSKDGKLYAPGTEFTVEKSVYFTAKWNIKKVYAEYITLDYAEYEDGIVSGRPVATIEQVEKDGRITAKITPTPDAGAPLTDIIKLDGYNYNNAGIDLRVYRWATMEYYYESDAPVEDKLFLSMLRSGDVFVEGQHYANTRSTEPMVANTWSVALFDFSILDEKINEANSNLNLRQMHFEPWDTTKLGDFKGNDAMYIGELTFYQNKPDLATHSSYMNGYEDGTFRPSGTMTRAEACTVIARLLEAEENIAGTSAFADVPADQWYAKYIGFCEAKGLLGAYSGNFLPNQPITRAEFSELVYLTGLAQDKGIAASFADVAATHPKYASIMAAASAGLINGYAEADGTFTFKPDNTITRAEVVTVINRARGTSKKPAQLTADMAVLFLDVDDTHWAFADIAEATVPHIELSGSWHIALADPVSALAQKLDSNTLAALYNLDAGKSKIAELDALEAKRIEEIKNTPNMDLSHIKGKKIYVSASLGDDKNDGLSEENPVKTLSKANSLARAGDAVLLARGNIWRSETIAAKADVTYTAYGEGAKPAIYGSKENGAVAENWSLVHEDTATGAKIWQYSNATFTDTGALVFNGGEGYAKKQVAPYYNSGKYYTSKAATAEYDYKTALENFEFFQESGEGRGAIYLRCDNGNPGKIFDSIEFIAYGSRIAAGTNSGVTIDNICFMYSNFGITAGTQKNLKVTNCEIGWIGGCGSYSEKSGTFTRLGNGVEVFGGCDGYTIDNCYIYQCYDAGVTNQVSAATPGNIQMNNITYSNNVITDCVYSIEYFFGVNHTKTTEVRTGENFLIENNLLRRAGFGHGSHRPDIDNQRHIRSGKSANPFTNFVIRNNVFDRALHELIQVQSDYETTLPAYEGNTFIQGVGNKLYLSGVATANANLASRKLVNNALGDKTGTVYFTDNIPKYSYSYKTDKTAEITEEDREVKEIITELPEEEDVGSSAIPTVSAEPGESTEIFQPLFSRVQAKTKVYNEVKTSMNVEVLTDETFGIKYAHTTFTGEDQRVMYDCYGLPNVSCESGAVYIKLLIRSNLKIQPSGMIYTMVDENGSAVAGGVGVKTIAPITGSGEWEEIIIKASAFPDGAVSFKHIQMNMNVNGKVLNGKNFFDGTYPIDSYIDFAAWAAFPNLASALNYDILTAAMG